MSYPAYIHLCLSANSSARDIQREIRMNEWRIDCIETRQYRQVVAGKPFLHPGMVKLSGIGARSNVIEAQIATYVIAVEYSAELAVKMNIGRSSIPTYLFLKIDLNPGFGVSHRSRTSLYS
jgi:hypothetical protein